MGVLCVCRWENGRRIKKVTDVNNVQQRQRIDQLPRALPISHTLLFFSYLLYIYFSNHPSHFLSLHPFLTINHLIISITLGHCLNTTPRLCPRPTQTDQAAGCGTQAAHRPIDASLSHRPKSLNTTRAQFLPGAPITPPPGCVPAPHKYRPGNGVRYPGRAYAN